VVRGKVIFKLNHAPRGLGRATLDPNSQRRADVVVAPLTARYAESALPDLRSHQGRVMKHILVATDFSPNAAGALRHAASLAQLSGAKITLLHVIFAEKISETLLGLDALEYLARAADEGDRGPGSAFDRLRDAAKEKLADAIKVVAQPRPTIEPVVAEGRPSVEIAGYAAANNVDLIVLGTHGRGPIGKAFLGSVADNVLRQAEIPVMVVPK
jgi:nucleotide-binding universal stress UspA family protein